MFFIEFLYCMLTVDIRKILYIFKIIIILYKGKNF